MRGRGSWLGFIGLLLPLVADVHAGSTDSANSAPADEHIFERTFESRKHYADPFNDVDVDVIFSKDGTSWRVPTFWQRDQHWTVRFGPTAPGTYEYRLESTDKSNPDLNDHRGRVTLSGYSGESPLLKHGAPRVSLNRRYFEHADGTPFYWLGDTWWTGLSDRLSWEGFQRLTVDRQKKGFTVVQIVAGLVPEEQCPDDPGCRNEGGGVWGSDLRQINPKFFDFADRRVEFLLNKGIVPAMVGGWSTALEKMGVARMKKHWRYIIARYGAYPVFWVVGGEVFDPSMSLVRRRQLTAPQVSGEWTEIARYIRSTDPYRHPMTVHEVSPDNLPLQDEALTDFRLFQPAHFGWPSIGVEVAQLTANYSRTAVTKPLVVGEVGYEMLGRTHLEDFQRMAFWLAMLNGAAGHTYGAVGTWESYTAERPFQRNKWSFLTWEEGMNLPGSYQLGLGARLLRNFEWWRFEPHPDWVTPRGTTMLEPRGGQNDDFHMDLAGEWGDFMGSGRELAPSEWQLRNGTFRLPYAAGIPNQVRVIYAPYFGLIPPSPPTVLDLEPGVEYRAYYWEPSLGIKVDLGHVEAASQGPVTLSEPFSGGKTAWKEYRGKIERAPGSLSTNAATLAVIDGFSQADLRVAVTANAGTDAGVVLRFQDVDNYIAAVYSSQNKEIYLLERKGGEPAQPRGRTSVDFSDKTFRLTTEIRGGIAVMSLTVVGRTFTTPIENVAATKGGGVGLTCECVGSVQRFQDLEVRKSLPPRKDDQLERRLFDAEGRYRGELAGHGDGSMLSINWSRYGVEKNTLLNAYRPDAFPTSGDWILVLDAAAGRRKDRSGEAVN